MTTIRKVLEDYVKKGLSKEDTITNVISKTGAKRDSVVRMYRDVTGEPSRIDAKQLKSGRTLQEFKQTYDKNTYVPQKIRDALKELGDAWEYESEFVKRSGVNYTDLNIFREMFADYFIFIRREGKKIWCGTKTMALQLKELI